MDASNCLNQLGRMLAEETRLLGQLELQLQNEYRLLVAGDVEGLEQAADARQASVVALARLDEDRRGLCRMLGKGDDQVGLADLARWCDPTGSLASAHAAAAQQAQHCREQNDRNGALVNARLNHLHTMMDKLDGNKSASGTYEAGRMNRSPAAAGAGRMLSISA